MEKDASNVAKHGVSFDVIEMANWELSFLIEIQWVDDEERDVYILPIGYALYSVVTTERHDKTRLISLRLAETYEKKVWRSEFQHG